MATMLRVTVAVCLLVGLASCQKPMGSGKGFVPVKITLSWESNRCKPHVDPDSVTVYKANPHIRWTVVDNCTPDDSESETQLAFKYQPHTPKKWLDALAPIARTKKGTSAVIEYLAVAGRGQNRNDFADYTVIFNGTTLQDPKVVWGN